MCKLLLDRANARALTARLLTFLALTLPTPTWARLVGYSFSGTWEAPESPGLGSILNEGDAFQGSIVFDSEAPIIPGDENDSWFTYRPSATLRLSSAGHTWSNVPRQNRVLCSVDMHVGWLEVLFLCPIGSEGLPPAFLMMRWANLSGPSPRGVPYPLGPFQPDTFREQEILASLRLFVDDGWVINASPTLDAVKVVGEPSALPLTLACAFWLLLTCRRRHQPESRMQA